MREVAGDIHLGQGSNPSDPTTQPTHTSQLDMQKRLFWLFNSFFLETKAPTESNMITKIMIKFDGSSGIVSAKEYSVQLLGCWY